MRICYDLRIQNRKSCKDHRSFRVMNGFNSKMLDILNKMRKNLIDVVEDKIAFPSDNGCLMFEESSYLRQNSLSKLLSEKISQHCQGSHDDKCILGAKIFFDCIVHQNSQLFSRFDKKSSKKVWYFFKICHRLENLNLWENSTDFTSNI